MKVYKRANPFDESSKEGNSEIIQPEIENIQEVNLVRFDVNTEDHGFAIPQKSENSKTVTAKRFQEHVRVHIYLAIIQTGNHSNRMFRFQALKFLSSRL